MHFSAKPYGPTPVAAEHPVSVVFHGHRRLDPYAWLRSENWQEALRDPQALSAPIRAYLAAENAYCDKALHDTKALQAQLLDELRGRIVADDQGVPMPDGPYEYNWAYPEGAEHERLFRCLAGRSEVQWVLDAQRLAESERYFALGETAISPEHSWLAWSADTQGAECYRLRLRHINSQVDLPYVIDDVAEVAWVNEQVLLYTQLDEYHRPSRVWRHRLGQSPDQDQLVYQELDSAYEVGLARSRSGAYVLIHCATEQSDEVWLLDTASPESEPWCFCPREPGLEYGVEHQNERFLILTNADGAIDFKLMETPVSRPQRAHWRELLSHQSGRTILSVDAFAEHLVWFEREQAVVKIAYQKNTGERGSVAFDQAAYALGLDLSPDYHCRTLRFSYSSPIEPTAVYDFYLDTGQRKLLKRDTIPSGHNPDHYRLQRLWVPSDDGALVPVTLFYHRDTPLDGSAPGLVYGYGAYGCCVEAEFSSARISLLDRGFVYVLAHVRGGQECGRAWFDAAKRHGKPRSLADFIAVSAFLVDRGYVAADKLVAMGASAGGLLIGAVINQAPEHYAAAVADVPFVDMLNTLLDEQLPLTPGEWPQWGNPLEDPEAYGWIHSYSPYDNVRPQTYPALLVTAGVSDPRVTYWEPAKWVARLRQHQRGEGVILLHTQLSAGHFGASGRYAGLADIAHTYAFVLKAVGYPLPQSADAVPERLGAN